MSAALLLGALAGGAALARPGGGGLAPRMVVSRPGAITMLGDELTTSLSATVSASSAAWSAAIGAGSDAWSAAWASASSSGGMEGSNLLSNPNVLAAGISALAIVGGSQLFANRPPKPIGAPYAAGPNTYDPVAADAFYAERMPLVIGRLLRLGYLTTAFNLKLLADWQAYKRMGSPEGVSWPNEKSRASEALGLATQLGPTFIKLAQALSIRTDLIPEAYALELRQLQDAVPPFDSVEARAILQSQLGIGELSSRFASLSEEPIAAASIGQVYKGTTLDGRQVAVKVQRPQILDEIALDLYLLRILTPLQTRISNMARRQPTEASEIELARNLVDEWGRGFVAEADYLHEATNTKQFSAAMATRGLSAVCSPAVVDELSTSRVLVTEWVDEQMSKVSG